MLRGSVIFQGHKIELKGMDLSGFMLFIATANDFETVDMFDEIEGSSGLFTRNLQINPTTCKSEIKNKEFNSVLAGTIRYAKANCYSKYRDILFEANQEVFSPEKSSIYNIPNLGYVKMTLGFISEMEIETSNIKISLFDDSTDEEGLFRAFDAKSYNVKITKELLGFEPYVEFNKNAEGVGVYKDINEITINNPLKDYKWLSGRKYIIVDDEHLEEVCNRLMRSVRKIAFDTETTGLNITFKSRSGQADVVVGVILTDKIGESYYFPLQHKSIKNLCNGDHEFVMGTYIKPILESKDIVCHNASFDWKAAHIYDINTHIVDDTMVAFQCSLGYKYKDFRVGLKSLIKNIFGRDSLELDDLVYNHNWENSGIRFWDLPKELVRLYACADGDNTLDLLNYIEKTNLLSSYDAKKIYDFEVIFSLCVAYQEFYGHRVNIDEIPELQADNDKILAKNYQKMRAIVGEDFNPASAPQMQKILYEKLGLPIQYKFEKGKQKVTCDKDARKVLMEYEDDNGEPLYPIVHYYHEWCTAGTIKSNFLKGLPVLATPDGYMFPSVKQFGTTTGRLSIKEPNYQSYNKPVKVRIVPRPGFYMTDNDYSSIEYRILAFMSGQEQLIEAFRDPDLNYHTYQAARMFDIPYEAVTEDLRKRAKGINFGLPYGMGDPSLGARVFGQKTKENTLKARELRNKYFEGQEKVRDFFDRVRQEGVDNGYTSTYYGRRRWYDKNRYDTESIKRQAGNAVIQGTAADVYKIGVVRMFITICKKGWLGKALMPAFVHDETLFEVHKSIDPIQWMSAVKEAFELNIPGSCPLYIGFGYGENWYEAKSIELPVQLQNNLVERYGETGYPEWDGDTNKFCKWINSEIENYELTKVRDFIFSKENQGKVITPVVNTYLSAHANKYVKDYLGVKAKFIMEKNLTNVVKADELKKYLHDDKKIQISEVEPSKLTKYKAELLADKFTIEEFERRLAEHEKDSSVLKELETYCKEEAKVPYLEQFRPTKDTLKALDIFCYVNDVNRGDVNILSVVVKKKEEVQENTKYTENDDEIAQIEAQNMRLARVKTLGLCINTTDYSVILNLVNNKTLMDMVRGKLNNEQKGYKVKLYSFEKNMMYNTEYYIAPDKLKEVQQLYLMVASM